MSTTTDVKLNFATDWKYAPAPETAKVQLRARYDLFIDGKFTPPVKGKYFETANPATTGAVATVQPVNHRTGGRSSLGGVTQRPGKF